LERLVRRLRGQSRRKQNKEKEHALNRREMGPHPSFVQEGEN